MSITDEMNNELERMFDQGVAHERGRIRRATMKVRNRLVRVKAAALDASDKEHPHPAGGDMSVLSSRSFRLFAPWPPREAAEQGARLVVAASDVFERLPFLGSQRRLVSRPAHHAHQPKPFQ